MIVTVTANTTLDYTLFVPKFEMNRTMRATGTTYSMGGKPTDASWILGEIGIPSLALGFAAGHSGARAKAMLEARGVTTDFIEVGGETRINVVIISEDNKGHSTITTSSLEIEEQHINALREKFLAALDGASCVILGGTLPRMMRPEFYTEFVALGRERGLPVIFDADEPNLSAGLKSRPTYIKPNRDELSRLTGQPVQSVDDAYRAGRDIFERTGTCPIITLGGDGALAVLPDRAYRIPPLAVEAVSPAGAGDAVLAGLAASIERGQPVEEGLRLGIAAATAVCLMPGTADCRRADVEHFLPLVELLPYPG
ncbi:MAG: tagatose-6-phosphate kinase [Chloroflexota bacterium]|nr:MAG: tagatose-6-phosphate kinase [Chloroflexota bacterium]